MLLALIASIAGDSMSGEVTVSGEAIADSDSGGATCSVIFRADGTVDKKEGAVTSQIDSATDWIIPNELGNSTYDVRYTGHSGDAFTDEAAVENTWIDLGSDRTWTLTKGIPGQDVTTVTFEIRDSSATTLDTAVYTFTVTVSA